VFNKILLGINRYTCNSNSYSYTEKWQ